jgi:potassium-transporting ATPase KdpC subunit
MKAHIIPAIRLTLVCMVVFAGLYSLLILGMAQLTPYKGKGETIIVNGKKQYGNIGQNFTSDRYFYSRPSAVGYNAAGSGGSNKGPSNPEYLQSVKDRIDTFMAHNPGVEKSAIPSDLVTASGSGLDPHISVEAAMVQAKRIAAVRKMDVQKVEALIAQHTEQPLFGMMGVKRINVLKLNLALDGATN